MEIPMGAHQVAQPGQHWHEQCIWLATFYAQETFCCVRVGSAMGPISRSWLTGSKKVVLTTAEKLANR